MGWFVSAARIYVNPVAFQSKKQVAWIAWVANRQQRRLARATPTSMN